MSRREWFFWGYVLWVVFGLFGVLVVLAPYNMGIADEPSVPWMVAGFVGGLLFFVALELTRTRSRR